MGKKCLSPSVAEITQARCLLLVRVRNGIATWQENICSSEESETPCRPITRTVYKHRAHDHTALKRDMLELHASAG